MENISDLDLHGQMIMDEYYENMPVYKKMEEIVHGVLEESLKAQGIYINALETRVKTEKSLAGKLELKGSKYKDITDLTDIVGARVITFYIDEVDKIAALVDKVFDVDWKHSVDKRKVHELNTFGYSSLHYICRIPKERYFDPAMPQLNELRFELQMRTALQHVWATMYHDTGYKSGVEVPPEHLRNLNRLAGMMELADEQFSIIRTSINNYRRQVQSLVSTGHFEEVQLNADTFKSYMDLKPFDALVKRIAAINQAEIHNAVFSPYLPVLKELKFETLADIEKMIKEDSDDAYQYAVYQIATTDLDILSSTVAIQDLLIVHVLKAGMGVSGLQYLFDLINGKSAYNEASAKRAYETAMQLHFMHK